MGTPVRLVLGQHPDESYIHLDAATMSMNINRNIGHFTLPFTNDADRLVIDTNTPAVQIEISGLMRDDEGIIEPKVGGNTAAISCYDFYPNTNGGTSRIMDNVEVASVPATVNGTVTASSTTTINYSSSGTTGRLHHYANAGDKIYTDRGAEIGTISSVTASAVVLSSASAVNMSHGDKILLETPGSLLHGKRFYLFPAHWSANHPASLTSQFSTKYGIGFQFDNTLVPSQAGGSDTAALITSGNPVHYNGYAENYNVPCIKVPIKNLYNATTAGNSSNPSIGLANAIKDAINSSVAVTVTGETTSGGSKTVGGAFTATVSGATVIISQDEIDTEYTVSKSIISGWSYRRFIGNNLGYAHTMNQPIWMQFKPPQASQSGNRSAGDKAQDLLGLMANSDVGDTDYINGIQIPYHSLVTSSNGIDPTVRNFFTTYGAVTIDSKSSESNYFDGGGRMEASNTRNLVPSSPSAFLSDLFDYASLIAGGIWDIAVSIFSGNIGDWWSNLCSGITLPTGSQGNVNGIHIVPTKMNIRYEATENAYYFDLVLTVIDRAWGP